MTRSKGKHLSRENREAIEAGIRGGDPARAIAGRIDAGPSTVTREAKARRTVAEKRLSPKGGRRFDARTGAPARRAGRPARSARPS